MIWYSVDVPVDLTTKRSVTLLSQTAADREGVTGVRPFTEPILPMVHHGLADYGERFITRQGANRSRIVVASSEDHCTAGVQDFCQSLRVAAEPHRPTLYVTNDHPLIEFANELGLDRKSSAIGEVQDSLIAKFVSTSDHVRDPLLVLPDELGRPDAPECNLACEGASGMAR